MFHSEEYIIKKVSIDKTGRVSYEFKDRTEWVSSNIKDYYSNFKWRKLLKAKVTIRLWVTQLSRVAAIEYYDKNTNEYIPIWYVGNNFDCNKES